MLYEHTSDFHRSKTSPIGVMDKYKMGELCGEICQRCNKEYTDPEDIQDIIEWGMCVHCDHLLSNN